MRDMKILAISDVESKVLYEGYDRSCRKDVDIVISCGDLSLEYLEFIVTMINVPCFYVPGNHDERFVEREPPGWIPLDGRVVRHKGINILGLGGSMKYRPGPYQYTEVEMRLRFLKVLPKLWLNRNQIDILVTHAPAYDLGDLEGPHRGFKLFRRIIEKYKPKYHLHGHVHLNYAQHARTQKYKQTSIINGYDFYSFRY